MQKIGVRDNCELRLPADAALILRDRREGGINNTNSEAAAVPEGEGTGWDETTSSVHIQP